MQATEPQAILTPTTEAAIFLIITVDPGGEAGVREPLSDVSARDGKPANSHVALATIIDEDGMQPERSVVVP